MIKNTFTTEKDYKSPSQNRKHATVSPHQSQELFTIVHWPFIECNGDILKLVIDIT